MCISAAVALTRDFHEENLSKRCEPKLVFYGGAFGDESLYLGIGFWIDEVERCLLGSVC